MQLFDNICRILATPMPRSRALKLIFGGLGGAVLAPFAFGDDCPNPDTNPQRCGSSAQGPACCPPGQTCCLLNPFSNSRPVCCARTQGCDGNGACGKPSPKQT